ncbi:MAG TPA: hypothetical protein VFK73_09630, partial [Paludibacter sp.]|nr:hypothetical protein [Paludibacter sp.]
MVTIQGLNRLICGMFCILEVLYKFAGIKMRKKSTKSFGGKQPITSRISKLYYTNYCLITCR